MTIKRYRKVLARLALSASLLVGMGSAEAIAQPLQGRIAQNLATGQASSITASKLLHGRVGTVRVPSQAALFPSTAYPALPKVVQAPRVGYSQQRSPVVPAIKSRQAIAPQSPEPTQPRAVISAPTIPTRNTLAQLTDSQIRSQLLIEPNFVPEAVSERPRPVPASSFLTPTAYGADWGDAYIGLAQVTGGRPASSNFDGSAAIGIGFGDAVKNVGLEVSTSIISLNGIGEDGIVGFKLHKVFPKADNLAVALGWSNPIKWGAAKSRDNHFYGVASKQFDLRPKHSNPLPLTASVGLGTTGHYRAPSTNTNDNSLGIFGSLGLRVIPDVSLITTWTGTSMGIAASATPFDIPLVLTIGASDITDNTVEGPRFNSSIGYSFSF